MKDFKKFDLNEPQETTASGDTFDSVAAPKEDYRDKLIASENSQIKYLQSELASLRDQLRQRGELIKEMAGALVEVVIISKHTENIFHPDKVSEFDSLIKKSQKL